MSFSDTATKKKIIVWDLDECLLKAEVNGNDIAYQVNPNATRFSSPLPSFFIQFGAYGSSHNVKIALRQHALNVIQDLHSRGYEQHIFTAGIKEYSEAVWEQVLDLTDTIFTSVLTRNDCTKILVKNQPFIAVSMLGLGKASFAISRSHLTWS